MWEDFRKFLKNQKREGAPVEKVLGDTTKVNAFSQFYENHQEDLAVQAAGSLYNYMTDAQGMSTEEVVAFRAGLAQAPLFFEQCYIHVQQEINKAAQQSQSEDEPSS